jgi:opacity protein-like surface antigen
MLSNSNNARVLAASIFILAGCAIRISAQTPAAARVNPVSETKEALVASQTVPSASATNSDTSQAEAEVHVRAKDPVLNPAHVDTTATAGVAKNGPAPVVRTSSTTPQATASDEWQFQFTPYFWLASLHGTGGVGNRSAQVDMSFGDIFGSLKFALMGVFEARKDKFLVVTDLEYVSIEDDKATPGPLFSSVNAGFKTFIFDPEVGYRLYEDEAKGASVDVLGGARIWHVSTDLNFGSGLLPAQNIQGSRNWLDGVVGLRGKTAVSKKMFVTGKFDLGGGGSKFTWQLFAGGGYNVKPNIALIAGYRVLDVNYRKNNFIYDMNQRGPIMGLGFKF